MPTDVVITDDVKEDIEFLPDSMQEATINWCTGQLAEDPGAAGIALRGSLEGYRCLTSPQGVRFVFVASTEENIAIILLVYWSDLALVLKRVDLLRRLQQMRHSSRAAKIIARLKGDV